MSHSREAKLLCRKTVSFFSLLAHNQETPEQKAMVTQELLALVTGLAHYLKILIRIALTGSLKLEREHGNVNALDFMLQRLSLLARDDADPAVPVRGRGLARTHFEPQEISQPPGFIASTKGIAYGYRSLAVSTNVLCAFGFVDPIDTAARNRWRDCSERPFAYLVARLGSVYGLRSDCRR